MRTFAGIPKEQRGAVIKEPFGLVFGPKGDLFISDGDAGKIWQADKNGTLKILTDKLDTPSMLAIDKSGAVLVADSGSHTIKKIDVANGDVTLVAGVENRSGYADGNSGAALFNAPIGIAVDDNGKIFVADTYNDRVRVIENGKVSTLAGSVQGFADAADGVGPRFDTPCGLAVTKEGDLLVADTGNRRVRLIERSGRVSTFAGGEQNTEAGAPPTESVFAEPTDIKIDARGVVYITDTAASAVYTLGPKISPVLQKLNSGKRGLADGAIGSAKFNRPVGMALNSRGDLFVADSENQLVRILQNKDGNTGSNITAEEIAKLKLTAEEMKEAAAPRWPYAKTERAREIAGTLGEVRGEIAEGKDAWFHNGLDIAGGYGEIARFIRTEKVLRPFSVQLFNTLRENLRLPTLGYIHLRLGRDQNNRPFADPRFMWSLDETGKLGGVRVRRGAKFEAGEPIGTLNSMNHVHLIAGRSGDEMNALSALALPGVKDSIAPVVGEVHLLDESWRNLGETQKGIERIKLSGKVRITAQAYDRIDGNAERRRLGVFRLGYQILRADGSAAEGFGESPTTISFSKLPDNGSEDVGFVYAQGSKSGATGETIFNYIVTNFVQNGEAREDFFDTGKLPPGDYTLRVFAADIFGNESSKDIKINIAG